MNVKKIITQCKRELWENRTGFIYAPVAIAIFCVLIGVVMLVAASSMHLHTECIGDCGHDSISLLNQAVTKIGNDSEAFNGIVLSAMYSNCTLLSIAFCIVLLVYATSCLYDDRKSKEILFWRSMPLSETTNVLVKLAVLLFVMPIVVFIMNEIVTFLFIIIGALVFTINGVSFSTLMGSIFHGNSLYIPMQILYENVFGMLMLLPFLGFLQFCSAFAKRSPLVLATIIPALLMTVDYILGRLASFNIGVLKLLGLYWQALVNVKSAYILRESLIFNSSMIMPFIICTAVGAIFVAGSIWLRNYRYEI